MFLAVTFGIFIGSGWYPFGFDVQTAELDQFPVFLLEGIQGEVDRRQLLPHTAFDRLNITFYTENQHQVGFILFE